MKITVTGANGFIGKRLVKSLRDMSHEVIGLDLPEFDMSGWCADDPAYCELLKGTECIYHLAVMNLEHCKKDPHGCIKNNIVGTLNVMELVARLGIRRAIYSSASSVYGNSSRQPVDEMESTKPLSLYGVTKLASENIVQLYQKNFSTTTMIFRFSNVYGPGQVNGLIPSVISKLIRGDEITVTGDGNQTRDFVYVDDVVGILVRALNHPMYSILCNLGSGKSVSVNTVVDLCSKCLGTIPAICRQPFEIDRNKYCADISLLKRLYPGFVPTDFEHGIKLTVEAWIKEK